MQCNQYVTFACQCTHTKGSLCSAEMMACMHWATAHLDKSAVWGGTHVDCLSPIHFKAQFQDSLVPFQFIGPATTLKQAELQRSSKGAMFDWRHICCWVHAPHLRL